MRAVLRQSPPPSNGTPLLRRPAIEAASFEFFSARPAPPLAEFVESIWAVRGSSGYRRFTMLPNGAVQLMINFGAAHKVTAVGGRNVHCEHRQAWLAGLQYGPLSIESPLESDLLSIRFRPGGAHAFMRATLDAATDDVVDAECLFGSGVRSLREQLALAGSRLHQVATAERWLLRRLHPREQEYALVARALAALSDEQRTPVREACARLGLNHARMIRLFRRLTGLPPKALANVQRFQRGLALLAHGGIAHGDIALRLGYYDQAHFNREFLRFAGAAPGEFVRRRGEDNESLVDAWIDSAPSSSPETQAHQCGCLSLPTMRASM